MSKNYDKSAFVILPVLIGYAWFRYFAGDYDAFISCLFFGLMGLIGVLIAVWIKEVRKLDRMQAEAAYMRTLKGADLVKYLIEVKGWGKDKDSK